MPLFGPPNLKKMETQKNIKGLIKTLESNNDPDIRCRSAYILGNLGDISAIDTLMKIILEDKVAIVRIAAASAINKMKEGYNTQKYRWEPRLTNYIEPLTRAFRDEEAEVRRSIALALSTLSGPQVTDSLIKGLSDSDEEVQNICAKCILKIVNNQPDPELLERAENTLISNLKKGSIGFFSSAQALGEFHVVKAIPDLVEALSSKYKDFPQAACKALEQIGTPEGLDAIKRNKERIRPKPETVSDFAEILCKLIDKEKQNDYPNQQSIDEARYYGQILNQSGGFELMQKVMQRIIQLRPFDYQRINSWWDGIGNWRY